MCCERAIPDSEIAVENGDTGEERQLLSVCWRPGSGSHIRIRVGDTCQHGHGPCHDDTGAADHEQRRGGAGEEQAAGGCRAL